MPIHKHDEIDLYEVTSSERLANQQPRIAAPEYRSAVVETRFTPLSNLLTTVEGSPWRVNYFSRVLGQDEAPELFDPTLPPVWQQYMLVNDLILKVSEPLGYVQQEESNDPLVQGESILHRSVVPNVGDVILADIGDGNEGIFAVTYTERKSLFKESVFVIRYVFRGFSQGDAGKIWLGNLLSKVVKTTYYNDDYTNRANGPLLTSSEVNLKKELASSRSWLINTYISKFYSSRYNTFILPGSTAIYDPYSVKAFISLVSGEECPLVYKISPYRVDGQGGVEGWLLWDLITKSDYSLLSMIYSKAWRIIAQKFAIYLTLGTVAYSGINSVVVPKGKIPGRIEDVDVGGDAVWEVIDEPYVPVPMGRVKMHSVAIDDYYVFSEAFYQDDDVRMSELEIAIKNYTSGLAYDGNNVLAMCREIAERSPLDQFYYIPVLIALTHWAILKL